MDKMLKVRDVQELLGISGEQVRRLVHNHGLPCYHLSPRIMRFKEDEVQAWAKRRLNKPCYC